MMAAVSLTYNSQSKILDPFKIMPFLWMHGHICIFPLYVMMSVFTTMADFVIQPG